MAVSTHPQLEKYEAPVELRLAELYGKLMILHPRNPITR